MTDTVKRRKILIITDPALHEKWIGDPQGCLREAGYPPDTEVVRSSIHQDDAGCPHFIIKSVEFAGVISGEPLPKIFI